MLIFDPKQMKEVLTTRNRGCLCRQELDSEKTSGRKGIIKRMNGSGKKEAEGAA
jgi:hypothetical protein